MRVNRQHSTCTHVGGSNKNGYRDVLAISNTNRLERDQVWAFWTLDFGQRWRATRPRKPCLGIGIDRDKRGSLDNVK